MKRNNYYPSKNTDQVAWLSNFRTKLPNHATALSLALAVVNVWTGIKPAGNDPVGDYTRITGCDPTASLTIEAQL